VFVGVMERASGFLFKRGAVETTTRLVSSVSLSRDQTACQQGNMMATSYDDTLVTECLSTASNTHGRKNQCLTAWIIQSSFQSVCYFCYGNWFVRESSSFIQIDVMQGTPLFKIGPYSRLVP